MINYFSRYVFSYQHDYCGSYLEAFIIHSVLLEEVELYSNQLTYLDEKGRNFFHNFIYNLYIIYNIKFCLLIQIPLDSQTFLILSARPLRGKGCFSITLSSLWLNTNIDMGENTNTSFPLCRRWLRSTSIATIRRMGLRGSGVESVVRRGVCPDLVCGSHPAEFSGTNQPFGLAPGAMTC